MADNRWGLVFRVNTTAIKTISSAASEMEKVSGSIDKVGRALNRTVKSFGEQTMSQVSALRAEVEAITKAQKELQANLTAARAAATTAAAPVRGPNGRFQKSTTRSAFVPPPAAAQSNKGAEHTLNRKFYTDLLGMSRGQYRDRDPSRADSRDDNVNKRTGRPYVRPDGGWLNDAARNSSKTVTNFIAQVEAAKYLITRPLETIATSTSNTETQIKSLVKSVDEGFNFLKTTFSGGDGGGFAAHKHPPQPQGPGNTAKDAASQGTGANAPPTPNAAPVTATNPADSKAKRDELNALVKQAIEEYQKRPAGKRDPASLFESESGATLGTHLFPHIQKAADSKNKPDGETTFTQTASRISKQFLEVEAYRNSLIDEIAGVSSGLQEVVEVAKKPRKGGRKSAAQKLAEAEQASVEVKAVVQNVSSTPTTDSSLDMAAVAAATRQAERRRKADQIKIRQDAKEAERKAKAVSTAASSGISYRDALQRATALRTTDVTSYTNAAILRDSMPNYVGDLNNSAGDHDNTHKVIAGHSSNHENRDAASEDVTQLGLHGPSNILVSRYAKANLGFDADTVARSMADGPDANATHQGDVPDQTELLDKALAAHKGMKDSPQKKKFGLFATEEGKALRSYISKVLLAKMDDVSDMSVDDRDEVMVGFEQNLNRMGTESVTPKGGKHVQLMQEMLQGTRTNAQTVVRPDIMMDSLDAIERFNKPGDNDDTAKKLHRLSRHEERVDFGDADDEKSKRVNTSMQLKAGTPEYDKERMGYALRRLIAEATLQGKIGPDEKAGQYEPGAYLKHGIPDVVKGLSKQILGIDPDGLMKHETVESVAARDSARANKLHEPEAIFHEMEETSSSKTARKKWYNKHLKDGGGELADHDQVLEYLKPYLVKEKGKEVRKQREIQYQPAESDLMKKFADMARDDFHNVIRILEDIRMSMLGHRDSGNVAPPTAEPMGSVWSGLVNGTVGGQPVDAAVRKHFATNGNANPFRKIVGQVAAYGMTGGAMWGTVDHLKEHTGQMVDYEESINKIQRVMNPIGNNIKGVSSGGMAIGQEYGQSIEKVAGSMEVFARQGKGMKDILNETRVAAMAANTTDLDLAESTEALISAQRQFNISTAQSEKILDSWVEIGKTTGVSAKVMSDAMKQAGTASKVAGVDFHLFNGLVAAVGETTRKSGEQVGNSLKYMMQHTRDMTAVQSLQKVGIFSEDQNGNMKSASAVLGELSTKWGSLNDAQKNQVATSIAGTQHLNDFYTVMEKWDRAVDLSVVSITSQGSAQRANSIAMETTKKKIDQLTASYESLWATIGQSGALDVLKQMADVANGIVKSITAASGAFGGLGAGLVGVGMVGGVGAGTVGTLAGQILPSILAGSQKFGQPGNFDQVTAAATKANPNPVPMDPKSASSVVPMGGYITAARSRALIANVGVDLAASWYNNNIRAKRPQGAAPSAMDVVADVAPTAVGLNTVMQFAKPNGKTFSQFGEWGRMRQLAAVAAVAYTGYSAYQSYKKYRDAKNNNSEANRVDNIDRIRNVDGKYGEAIGGVDGLISSHEQGHGIDPDQLKSVKDNIASVNPDIVQYGANGEVAGGSIDDLRKWKEKLIAGRRGVGMNQADAFRELLDGNLNDQGFKDAVATRRDLTGRRQKMTSANSTLDDREKLRTDLDSATATITNKGVSLYQGASAYYGHAVGGLFAFNGEQRNKAADMFGMTPRQVGVQGVESAISGITGGQTTVDVEALLTRLGKGVDDIVGYRKNKDGPVYDAVSGNQMSSAAVEQYTKAGKVIIDAFDTRFQKGIALRREEGLDNLLKNLTHALDRLGSKNDDLIKTNQFVINSRQQGGFYRDESTYSLGGDQGKSILSQQAANEQIESSRNLSLENPFREGGQISGVHALDRIEEMTGSLARGSESGMAVSTHDAFKLLPQMAQAAADSDKLVKTYVDRLIQSKGDIIDMSPNARKAAAGAADDASGQEAIRTSMPYDAIVEGLGKDAADKIVPLTRQIGEERDKAHPDQERIDALMKSIDALTAQARNTSLEPAMRQVGAIADANLGRSSSMATQSVAYLGQRYDFLHRTGAPNAATPEKFLASGEGKEIQQGLQTAYKTQLANRDLLQTGLEAFKKATPGAISEIERLKEELDKSNATLEILGNAANNTAELMGRANTGLREFNDSTNRVVANAARGSSFGLTGENETTYAIKFLDDEIAKLVRQLASNKLATPADRAKAADDTSQLNRYSDELHDRQVQLRDQQDQRDAQNKGLPQTVFTDRLMAISGVQAPGESSHAYVEMMQQQFNEYLQRISAEAVKGNPDGPKSGAMIRDLQKALAPLSGSLGNMMLAMNPGYQKEYLTASVGERSLADRVRQSMSAGKTSQEIFDDPKMIRAAKDSPLISQLLDQSVNKDALAAAAQFQQKTASWQDMLLGVQQDMLHVLDKYGVHDAKVKMFGESSDAPATNQSKPPSPMGSPKPPGMSVGSQALAGSHAVDSEGRIRRDGTPAVLHEGEIVLNKSQSRAFLDNHYDTGTLPQGSTPDSRLLPKKTEFKTGDAVSFVREKKVFGAPMEGFGRITYLMSDGRVRIEGWDRDGKRLESVVQKSAVFDTDLSHVKVGDTVTAPWAGHKAEQTPSIGTWDPLKQEGTANYNGRTAGIYGHQIAPTDDFWERIKETQRAAGAQTKPLSVKQPLGGSMVDGFLHLDPTELDVDAIKAGGAPKTLAEGLLRQTRDRLITNATSFGLKDGHQMRMLVDNIAPLVGEHRDGFGAFYMPGTFVRQSMVAGQMQNSRFGHTAVVPGDTNQRVAISKVFEPTNGASALDQMARLGYHEYQHVLDSTFSPTYQPYFQNPISEAQKRLIDLQWHALLSDTDPDVRKAYGDVMQVYGGKHKFSGSPVDFFADVEKDGWAYTHEGIRAFEEFKAEATASLMHKGAPLRDWMMKDNAAAFDFMSTTRSVAGRAAMQTKKSFATNRDANMTARADVMEAAGHTRLKPTLDLMTTSSTGFDVTNRAATLTGPTPPMPPVVVPPVDPVVPPVVTPPVTPPVVPDVPARNFKDTLRDGKDFAARNVRRMAGNAAGELPTKGSLTEAGGQLKDMASNPLFLASVALPIADHFFKGKDWYDEGVRPLVSDALDLDFQMMLMKKGKMIGVAERLGLVKDIGKLMGKIGLGVPAKLAKVAFKGTKVGEVASAVGDLAGSTKKYVADTVVEQGMKLLSTRGGNAVSKAGFDIFKGLTEEGSLMAMAKGGTKVGGKILGGVMAYDTALDVNRAGQWGLHATGIMGDKTYKVRTQELDTLSGIASIGTGVDQTKVLGGGMLSGLTSSLGWSDGAAYDQMKQLGQVNKQVNADLTATHKSESAWSGGEQKGVDPWTAFLANPWRTSELTKYIAAADAAMANRTQLQHAHQVLDEPLVEWSGGLKSTIDWMNELDTGEIPTAPPPGSTNKDQTQDDLKLMVDHLKEKHPDQLARLLYEGAKNAETFYAGDIGDLRNKEIREDPAFTGVFGGAFMSDDERRTIIAGHYAKATERYKNEEDRAEMAKSMDPMTTFRTFAEKTGLTVVDKRVDLAHGGDNGREVHVDGIFDKPTMSGFGTNAPPVRDTGGPADPFHTTIYSDGSEWVLPASVVDRFKQGTKMLEVANQKKAAEYDSFGTDVNQFRSGEGSGAGGTVTHNHGGEVRLTADTNLVGMIAQQVVDLMNKQQGNGNGPTFRVGDAIKPGYMPRRPRG